MDHLSLVKTDPFNELEREVLFSGKALTELTDMEDYINQVRYPRRAFRDKIARSIVSLVPWF